MTWSTSLTSEVKFTRIILDFESTCIRIAQIVKVLLRDLADLPPEQRLAVSVLVGLLNRKTNTPSAIGKINPTDDAWILSVQTEEPTLQNSTFQPVASLHELGVIAKASGLQQILFSQFS